MYCGYTAVVVLLAYIVCLTSSTSLTETCESIERRSKSAVDVKRSKEEGAIVHDLGDFLLQGTSNGQAIRECGEQCCDTDNCNVFSVGFMGGNNSFGCELMQCHPYTQCRFFRENGVDSEIIMKQHDGSTEAATTTTTIAPVTTAEIQVQMIAVNDEDVEFAPPVATPPVANNTAAAAPASSDTPAETAAVVTPAEIASSETAAAAPAATVTQTVTSTVIDGNITHHDATHDNTFDTVTIPTIVAIFSFSLVLVIVVSILVGKRCYESWRRRHYQTIDYLVEGGQSSGSDPGDSMSTRRMTRPPDGSTQGLLNHD